VGGRGASSCCRKATVESCPLVRQCALLNANKGLETPTRRLIPKRFAAIFKRTRGFFVRDRDVRSAVLDYLAALHAGDTDTRVVEEMGVWAGSARIDIAVINGELTGFELKSERDTLDRLPAQAEIYNLVFDRVCLVATSRHLQKALNIVPAWWGTYVVSEDVSGRTIMARRRAGRRNPSRDPLILAQLLWRDEVLALLDEHGLASGYRSKTAKFLHARLAEKLSLANLSSGVRQKLKARDGWLGQVRPNSLDVPVDTDANPGFQISGTLSAGRDVINGVVTPATS